MLPTVVPTIIASISRLVRLTGLPSVAAGICLAVPLTASAQGQPPAGCGGQWIYGPGQDDRALTSTQIGGSLGTMRAVEWDPDGRSGPERPWLVVMTSAMRPFAWDGERWRSLPQISATIGGPSVDVSLTVFRGELYALSRLPEEGVRKYTSSGWVTAIATGREVTAMQVDDDRLLLVDRNFGVAGGEQRLFSWDGTVLSALAAGLAETSGSPGGITTSIARWNGVFYLGGRWFVPVPSPAGTPMAVSLARVTLGSGGAIGAIEPLSSTGVPSGTTLTRRLIPMADRLFAVKEGGLNRILVSWDGTAWSSDGRGEPFEIGGTLYRIGLTGAQATPYSIQRLVAGTWVPFGPQGSSFWPAVGSFGQELIQQSDASRVSAILATDVVLGETTQHDVHVRSQSIRWSRVIDSGGRAIFAGLSADTGADYRGPQSVASPQVASFDGYEWRTLGPAMTVGAFARDYATANDLVIDGSLLYATSGNRFVGTTEINGIGGWNGQAWQPLGTGLSLVGTGTFAANRAVLFEGDLIVSGRFDRAGGQTVSNVARWDGSQWWPMGELPANASFAALNGKLYAMSGALYRWDGLAWTRLGRTFSFGAFDLKVWRGELYAAGTFTQVGGDPLPYIAVFRGGDWQALSVPLQQAGQQGTVGLSSIEPTANGLLAYGRFALPGETEARPRIAKWTGTTWEPVVSGLPTDTGFMTASTQLGNERIVAGNFVNISGQRSTNYARWSPDGRPWIAQPPRSATNSIGGSVDFKAEAATGYTGLVFKWLRNGEELTDGTTASGSTVLGANTRWLTVSNLQAADAGSYVLRISNPCGQSLSAAATLTLRCSASDVAGANQSVGSDGTLTADDIIVFLGWFFASDTRADVAGANQSTVPDGVFTADDIIVFLGRFFAGC